MWKDFLKNTVLKPGLERLGTIGATALVAGGDKLCRLYEVCGLVTEDGAHLVMTWVVAAALIAFDLVIIALNRKAR